MEIKELIQTLMKDQIKTQVLVGKIINVDESKMICDIDLQNAPDMLDVRLRAVIDKVEKGILIIPKKGSYVLVGLIDNKKESAFICKYSEVEKVKILCDDIKLGGDGFGGLVKSEKVASEINDLKSDMNTLKNLFTAWAPVTQDGGAALKEIISSWSGKKMKSVMKKDLENKKVNHG
jgi:hypothetical protein